ncbi:MAG: hypothetical protein KBD37_00160 [Burkholderiales bacterium]|nr:hypothetical protein [Burkholderiales bacterium]
MKWLIAREKLKLTSIKGYSVIELLFALCVISSVIYLVSASVSSMLQLYKAQNAAANAYKYAEAVVRYITTHQNLLRLQLEINGVSNEKIATITPQTLKEEGFIPNIKYANNNLNQTPCTIIFYDNHQLQSYVYYRDNNDSKTLNQRQLKDGLNHMGAMLGLYQNGKIEGAAKDWALDNNFISRMFVSQGNVDLSQGADSTSYRCNGSQIANNSYVVNVTSMLKLDNDLPLDDTIHQYSDVLHDVDESQSNNRMNSDLVMDYISDDGTQRNQSNVIFQNNPDCVMNYSVPGATDDYGTSNLNGCKNRQLAISVKSNNSKNQAVIITGFKRGGINDDDKEDKRPYVGEISAASIQPTIQVSVGTQCLKTELSKMAQQERSSRADDINNLYVSQVVCMKSPTCPSETGGYCYLPLHSVTINYTPNQPSAQCPVGMFISSLTTNVQEFPDWGSHCCATDLVSCIGNASAHNHYWEGYQLYKDQTLVGSYINGGNIDGAGAVPQPLYLPPTKSPDYLLANTAVMGLVDYGYTCDAICGCPSYPTWATRWQPNITSMTCTNDPSQAQILVPG